MSTDPMTHTTKRSRMGEAMDRVTSDIWNRGYARGKDAAADEIARLRALLEQALDCLNDETPEDCTREEARADTIQKIKDALNVR